MDLGEYIGASAIVVSIFLATAVFIWQSGRSDARIDRLDAKIEAQGDRITTEIRHEISKQNSLISEQGRRVSEVELEQARLNGVNSVIVNQIHSHDGSDD